MKNLRNLKGAQPLSKQEQQFINGGITANCIPNYETREACESNCAEICLEIVSQDRPNCYSCDMPQEQ